MTGDDPQRHASRDRPGFTLMELLVVLGVFSLVVTMASSIFLLANDAQRRTVLVNDAQADLRFVLEAIVREVRSGRIDYGFYEGAGGVELPADRLVLESASGQREAFFLSQDPAVCPSGVRGCAALSLDDGTPESLTSSSLHVDRFAFYVTPSSDPFTIDASSGTYPSDLQPTVTIVIEGETAGVKPEDVVPMNAQTTVTTRAYVR